MSFVKTAGKRALERTLAALNRADEIGGEVRDFVQDRVLRDERYVRARRRIDELRGKAYVSRSEQEAGAKARAEAVAKAAPAAGADTASEGPAALGNPELPAQVYGKSSCPWTGRAISLLEQMKADYDFVDTDDPDHEHLEAPLVAETGQKTTPWIYLRGRFIGGFNALDEVHRLGQLEVAMMSQEARADMSDAAKKLVVAPRVEAEGPVPGELN
ncbi:glutaredoxin [Haliangium sp.]|uniref:glutaredoxin n=1 Tax=Haliangium sp. TaxID=2663208 RepID=UPI003D0B719D